MMLPLQREVSGPRVMIAAKESLEHFAHPKPAYNTVSTIVRILEDKGFVRHQAFGKSHQYSPAVSKTDYSKFQLRNLTKGYFSNSFKSYAAAANPGGLNLQLRVAGVERCSCGTPTAILVA